MADPTPYEVSYDFSDFQTYNPATPLPGTQVDIQLADIAASTKSIANAVKDVRRSDGRLKNGVVTPDALSPGTQAMLSKGQVSVDGAFVPSLEGSDAVPLRDVLERDVWGLVNDGVTDCTALIEASWLRANGAIAAALAGELDYMGTAPFDVRLPPGRFVYNGAGLPRHTEAPIRFIGAGDGQTTIIITSDAYFFDFVGYVDKLHVEGIHFVGGKGVYRNVIPGSGVNVAGTRAWIDVGFSNYTECAINESGTDMPHLFVERCTFAGKAGEPTIGIALMGYNDQSSIRDNAFLRNKHNIKLAPGVRASATDLGPAGNLVIGQNDFTRFSGTDKVSDVWIVPNPETSVNAAFGTTIENQKFGNENFTEGQYKILIADEEAGVGTDNGTRHTHSTAKSNGHIGFLSVDNCAFQYKEVIGQPGTEPYAAIAPLYSFTRRLFGVRWGGRNMVSGTTPEFVAIQLDPAAEFAGEEPLAHSIVHVGPMEYDATRRYRAVSDPGMALVVDPAHLVQSDLSVPAVHHGGYDPAYVQLLASGTAYSSGGVNSAARSGTQPDAIGGGNATEVTFSTDTGFIYFQPDKASVDNGRVAWFEVDLMQAASQPISAVLIGIRSGDGWWIDRRAVVVPASWQTFRFPVVLPTIGAAQYRFQIMPLAADWETGVADKVLIGRPKLYHARNPVNNGHIETKGSGRWDGEHGILGTAMRFFVDASNRLRLKFNSAAPTSDTDGSIVTVYHIGTTAQRPATNLFVGRQYLDTTLGKPIWWNGTNWSDAMGNSGV